LDARGRAQRQHHNHSRLFQGQEGRPKPPLVRTRAGLPNFNENDRQCVKSQRFNKDQGQNQEELDSGPGAGISSQTFAGSGSSLTLAQSAEAGSDGHRKT